jgi:hypothetical protein
VPGIDLFFWDVTEGVWRTGFERTTAINAYYDEDGVAHFVTAQMESFAVWNQTVSWNRTRSYSSTLNSYCDTLTADGSDTWTESIFFSSSSTSNLSETISILDNGLTRATSSLIANRAGDSTYNLNGETSGGETYDDTDFISACSAFSDSGTQGETRPDSEFFTNNTTADTCSLTVDGVTIYSGTWQGYYGSDSTGSWGSTILGPKALRITNRLSGFLMDEGAVVSNKYAGVNTDRAKKPGYSAAYVSYNPYETEVADDTVNLINFV